MIVECEKQGFQIKFAKVLFPVKQRHAREVVLFPDLYWLFRIDHLLVLLGQNVVEGGL